MKKRCDNTCFNWMYKPFCCSDECYEWNKIQDKIESWFRQLEFREKMTDEYFIKIKEKKNE
jgi:hypothetical protein